MSSALIIDNENICEGLGDENISIFSLGCFRGEIQIY